MASGQGREWSTQATEDAWDYLTEVREDRTRLYVEKTTASVMTAKVRSLGETKEQVRNGETNVSKKMSELLALKLHKRFGRTGEDTWDCFMGFKVSMRVDWVQLADRLLRKFSAEYVPGEVESWDQDQ